MLRLLMIPSSVIRPSFLLPRLFFVEAVVSIILPLLGLTIFLFQGQYNGHGGRSFIHPSRIFISLLMAEGN